MLKLITISVFHIFTIRPTHIFQIFCFCGGLIYCQIGFAFQKFPYQPRFYEYRLFDEYSYLGMVLEPSLNALDKDEEQIVTNQIKPHLLSPQEIAFYRKNFPTLKIPRPDKLQHSISKSIQNQVFYSGTHQFSRIFLQDHLYQLKSAYERKFADKPELLEEYQELGVTDLRMDGTDSHLLLFLTYKGKIIDSIGGISHSLDFGQQNRNRSRKPISVPVDITLDTPELPFGIGLPWADFLPIPFGFEKTGTEWMIETEKSEKKLKVQKVKAAWVGSYHLNRYPLVRVMRAAAAREEVFFDPVAAIFRMVSAVGAFSFKLNLPEYKESGEVELLRPESIFAYSIDESPEDKDYKKWG